MTTEEPRHRSGWGVVWREDYVTNILSLGIRIFVSYSLLIKDYFLLIIIIIIVDERKFLRNYYIIMKNHLKIIIIL